MIRYNIDVPFLSRGYRNGPGDMRYIWLFVLFLPFDGWDGEECSSMGVLALFFFKRARQVGL